MTPPVKTTFRTRSVARSLAMAMLLLLVPLGAKAITFSPFGASGEGGSLNGQTFTVGGGGVVFEVDGFVNVSGQDLNGGASGTSAQLSSDALPAGLGFSFGSSLSADGTDLTLRYSFANNTGATLVDFTFISFLDAEIDQALNTFFNEYATTSGTLAAGQSFEVDEPGYLFGDIFDNALLGALDNTNALPASSADDVSMALGFTADLADGEIATYEIMISEDGDFLGPFVLSQRDLDKNSPTIITYSGQKLANPIPEPRAALLFAVGSLIVVVRQRGLARRD